MIKRIITFVLCLALCVSCVAIGLINQKANDADIAAGAIIGAGNGAVDKISADIPEGATQVEETELYEKDGVYYLGSDIDLVEGTNVSTYNKLVALIDNKANGETAVTIDGLGNTITTNKTLFTSIANVTIMNLNVAGSVETTASPCGVIANSAANFTVENVTNDADITYVGTNGVNIGGFFGNSSAPATYTDCVNNGNVTVDIAGLLGVRAGGIVAQQSGLPTFTNCVNSGDINVGTTVGYTWVGGIAGQAASPFINYNKLLNAGNVTAKNSTVTGDMIFVSGIIGHNDALIMTDAINLGNVSFIYSGTAKVTHADVFRINVGGIIGRGHRANTTFTRVINAGNVSMTDVNRTGSRNAIGGISPWRWNKNPGTNQFIDCLDIGTHSATTVDNMATITPYHDGSVSKTVNCYTTYFAGHKVVGGAFNEPSTGNDRYFITLPENIGTLLATIEEKQITDGAAIFSAILAVSEYDVNYEHTNDDGMFLSSFDGFTVTADTERNDYFTTVLNKEYLENVKTILGVNTVEFGAIIAPATYVTKIGAFSHDAFDAYYEANKDAIDAKVAENGHDPITALYVTAKFGDGADFTDVDGVYNAGIYLRGAYNTKYAAKMFIKIGNAYVYSK